MSQVGFHYMEAFTSVVRNLSEWRWSGTVPLLSLQGRFDSEQGRSVLAQAYRFVIGTLEAIGSYLSCILSCPDRSFSFMVFRLRCDSGCVCVSPFCHRRRPGSILGQCMWYIWWKFYTREQAFLRVLRSFSVSIIPPLLHAHSSITDTI